MVGQAQSTVARRALLALVAIAGFVAAGRAEAYTVYVSNEKDNTISVLDSESLQVRATWKVGRRPRGITLSLDGRWLYVCAGDDPSAPAADTPSRPASRT